DRTPRATHDTLVRLSRLGDAPFQGHLDQVLFAADSQSPALATRSQSFAGPGESAHVCSTDISRLHLHLRGRSCKEAGEEGKTKNADCELRIADCEMRQTTEGGGQRSGKRSKKIAGGAKKVMGLLDQH